MLGFLGRYVCAGYLANIVYAQERAVVTISSPHTPVYIGQRVMLTCSYGAGKVLTSITFDAFNGTRREGSLRCDVGQANTTATGVLAGQSFVGCPQAALARATNVSISLTATPSLALSYNCTAVVVSGNQTVRMMASASTLEVWVLPSTPKFEPSGLVLNESENVPIVCTSYGGSPVPVVRMTIILPNGSRIEVSGSGSAKLVMRMPLRAWLNATATCVVLNHNFRNMTTTKPVVINYLFSTGSPPTVFTNQCHAILDCSKYVSSFPSASYRWSASSTASPMQTLLLGSSIFTVLQGQSGLFNCTATNSITMKAVVIVFMVSNSYLLADDSPPTCDACWIAVVAAVIVVGALFLAAILLVLFKRGVFLRRKASSVSCQSRQPVLRNEPNAASYALVPAVQRQYESLMTPPNDEEHYTQLHSNQDTFDQLHYANVATS